MAAAAAAKLLQSCLTLQCHRWQPTRFPRPWDFPGKNTGVGWPCLLQCVKVKSKSEVTQSCLTLSNSMDCSLPGSSIHGIFRQEYWSGMPLPSPEQCGDSLKKWKKNSHMAQQSHCWAYTLKTRIERDTCTPVFIAALFTIARTWKEPRCPSTDEWIKK